MVSGFTFDVDDVEDMGRCGTANGPVEESCYETCLYSALEFG
jgi:hypothetical protein